MSSIADHRAAIKAALSSLAGDKFTHELKRFPSNARWVVSWPDSIDTRPTYGGERTLIYPVRFEIPWDDDESADAALETAMDAVVAAIEADTTLGGKVHSVACLPFQGIGAARLLDETVVMQFIVPVEVYD